MIAVTGMHRSGTSCFTGLLERCGFSLGNAYPLLNESRADNVKGHFENLGAVAINEMILRCSGGAWSSPPSQETLQSTSKRFSGHIKQFSKRFDGNIFKDPRLCLTIAFWKEYCPDFLEAVVLCLRHPAAVALSLLKRDNIQIAAGLELWLRYNRSLLEGISGTPLIVVDYDRLGFKFPLEIKRLMAALGQNMSKKAICRRTGNFYSKDLDHALNEEIDAIDVPCEVAALYRELRDRAYASNPTMHPIKSMSHYVAKFFRD